MRRDAAAIGDSDRYLSLPELEAYSGLASSTLRRYLHRATDPIPHARVGARVLVKRSEFDAWVEAQRVGPRPAALKVEAPARHAEDTAAARREARIAAASAAIVRGIRRRS